MKLLWMCSVALVMTVGCGGDDGGGGGGGGADGGPPGGSKNIACTVDTGAGHFCIGVENVTQPAYDSETTQCMAQHGTITDKCASANLAGCCKQMNGSVIALQCDYSDLPSTTTQHDMAGCTSPKTWVTSVP